MAFERATRGKVANVQLGRAIGAPFFDFFDRFGRPCLADRCLRDRFSADLGLLWAADRSPLAQGVSAQNCSDLQSKG